MRPSEIRMYERRGDGPGAPQHSEVWSLSSVSLGAADAEFSLKSCFGEALFFFFFLTKVCTVSCVFHLSYLPVFFMC